MIEWLARHRMALSIVFGILVPYPGSYVPIGLIFAVLLPTGGYWAIGIFAGGGGPSLLLLLGAIALAYAAAFWALTTVVLRRMFRVGLPWWPPRSPPVPWETLPRRTPGHKPCRTSVRSAGLAIHPATTSLSRIKRRQYALLVLAFHSTSVNSNRHHLDDENTSPAATPLRLRSR